MNKEEWDNRVIKKVCKTCKEYYVHPSQGPCCHISKGINGKDMHTHPNDKWNCWMGE
jgi:hypothetical protein